MKVFISHQLADSHTALAVSKHLKDKHGVSSYLDVINPSTAHGEDLAREIRANLGSCTQLLAVVSDATKLSWWVPWEIGVATEKDFPLATYANQSVDIPDYLKKWPYLRNLNDLDTYARVSKTAQASFVAKRSVLMEEVARSTSTRDFYRTLRGQLGQ